MAKPTLAPRKLFSDPKVVVSVRKAGKTAAVERAQTEEAVRTGKDQLVTFRITAGLLVKLDAYAEAAGLARSEAIRIILERELPK